MTLPLRAVLFDMDGTVLDTAPNMASALNSLRAEEALPPMAYDAVRCAVSHGTRLFPGMGEMLERLAERRLKAGIVTNKAGWLTEPLLEEMGLRARFDCVVSGDTLAERNASGRV